MSNGPGQNNLGTFQTGRSFAEQLDANDPLASMRERFELPRREDGTPISYLCGNSLGLSTWWSSCRCGRRTGRGGGPMAE